ncbi:hypothetical protein AGR7C_Lc20100 [Agrobacterium deltaense Zutra 3/1]|uniref:Uncharacterized protein n=1 Tax=Agrobacterium deltaense Zutra 3/1 TaxID=1183427 RepID=A0A1S7RL33_9HYPH|nr:hypothetical protein AGR7C_Lc20100 [Agrobacterium deltaense Zutra 3/1]
MGSLYVKQCGATDVISNFIYMDLFPFITQGNICDLYKT